MSRQELFCITGFRIVTADLDRLVRFYSEVLGFAVQSEEHQIGQAEMALLGLFGSGRRRVLTLGQQTLSIDRFEHAGKPYPEGSDAASLWFQHLALVVTDIAEAYGRLRDAAPISLEGPQRLPASSGGVQAFKFRDPDGHPLEFLEFPQDNTPAAWRARHPLPGQIGLGIDHSAICVADARASAGYYRALGLQIGDRTLNEGPEQQRLDDLSDVMVDVVPMKPPEAPPHLELLGYRMQSGCERAALQPNDVAATRIVWRGRKTELIRDPDGHLQQIETQEQSR